MSTSNAEQNFAIIVAAGRGRRAGGIDNEIPKQYRELGGQPVLSHALQAFAGHDDVSGVIVVYHPDDETLLSGVIKCVDCNDLRTVPGGETRQESVFAGLAALANSPPDNVLIHDAARPFVSPGLISRSLSALADSKAVLPVLPLTDTIKRGHGNIVTGTVNRSELFAAQTPQSFRFKNIWMAHEAASQAPDDVKGGFTDDASIAEWAGMEVTMIEGDTENRKLTTDADIKMADRKLRGSAHLPQREIRVGMGYDVHAFTLGDHVMLCGIAIPFDKSLHGHSDADVGLHALTDALLGAIGDGDIGKHFPPGDPRWADAPSEWFLAEAARKTSAINGTVTHVDVTIICEEPKISPHREQMRQKIAGILQIDKSRVSVKATTTEGLSFTGRREGIAAQAVATVSLPVY